MLELIWSWKKDKQIANLESYVRDAENVLKSHGINTIEQIAALKQECHQRIDLYKEKCKSINSKIYDVAIGVPLGAFVSAISTCLAEKCLVVVDELKFEAPKTKAMVEVLNALKLDKRTTIVTAENDENVVKSAANLENVYVTTAAQLCTYDIVVSDKLLVTKEAIKSIEEANK